MGVVSAWCRGELWWLGGEKGRWKRIRDVHITKVSQTKALSALVSLHHTLYSEGREEQDIGMCFQRAVEKALNAI